MTRAERKLLEYTQNLLVVSRAQLANHRQMERRALAIIGGVGLAFVISMATCMWSIFGVYRHKAEVIEQAMILQSIDMAMWLTIPQNKDTITEILPDGEVSVHDTK